MGTKVVLPEVTDIFAENTSTLISQALNTISDAFDNTVSRDGSDPSSLTANLDANGKRIINLATPVNNADAANKSYVDNQISSISSGSGSGSSGNSSSGTALGTTFVTDLTYDGTTDQSSVINKLIEDAAEGSALVFVSPSGGNLRLDFPVIVDKPLTLDFSATPITIGGGNDEGQGQFIAQGSVREFIPAFQLAANVSSGATQITVNDSPSGIDITDFSVGSVISIRGQNDASGNALQRDKNRIVTAVDTVNKIISFTPELENSYQTEYPLSDHTPEGDTVDRTLINRVNAFPLTADTTVKSNTVTVSPTDSTNFLVGDVVGLFNNRLAGDIAGASQNLIDRELFVVKSIDTSAGVVELAGRTKRAFTTADQSYIEIIDATDGVNFIGPSELTIASIDNLNREPIVKFENAINSTARNFRLNNIGNTVSPRGPMVRFEDSIACSAHNIARLEDDESLATSGDLYGVTFAIGATGCFVDGLFTMGCRHGFSYFQATDCFVTNHLGIADLINSGDWHGLNSYNCSLNNFIYVGHDGESADGTANTYGVSISNTFHNAGDFNVTAMNGVVTGFNGTSEAAFRIAAPSDNVTISNVHIRDCHFGILAKNEESVDGGKINVMNCTAFGLAAEAVYDGTTAGSNFTDGIEIVGLITDGTRTGTDSGSTSFITSDIVGHTAVNYTSAGTSLDEHLAGIDSALATLTAGGSVWGSIVGTLSSQTDLQTALDAKAASSHTHTLSDVTDAGTIASIDDAPSDGTTYGRKDGAWASVASIGVTNPSSRSIGLSSSTITITQTDINDGNWHFVNTNSSSVTINIPNGLTFPSESVSTISFFCASYSNPVNITVGSDYTNGTNGATLSAVGEILQILIFNTATSGTVIRAVKGAIS